MTKSDLDLGGTLDFRNPKVEQIQAEYYSLDDRDRENYYLTMEAIGKLIVGKKVVAFDAGGPDIKFEDGSILEVRGVEGTDFYFWHLKE